MLRNRRGQSMTEYIIIVAMVAIAAIVIFQLFGRQIRESVSAITKSLGTGKPQAARDVSGEAGQKEQGLDPFFKGGSK